MFSFMEMRPAQIDEEKTEDDFSKKASGRARSQHGSGLIQPGTLFLSTLPRSVLFFLSLSLLLKVGTSNPLLNLLNGAKPIYQLTHFRWIIYPFILSDNAADVTRGTEAVFRGDIILFSCSLSL